MDIIQIALIATMFIIFFAFIIKNQSTSHRTNKKRKKYHNQKNNFFRNNPEHVDMTGNYIETIWNEIEKPK